MYPTSLTGKVLVVHAQGVVFRYDKDKVERYENIADVLYVRDKATGAVIAKFNHNWCFTFEY